MTKFPPPLRETGRTRILYRGRRLSYFGGCAYYRLASDPRVRRALVRGLDRFGLNAAASRMTTGNHAVYEQLERELAKFFGAESAVLVPNGYATNLVVTQSLAGEFSHALLDERAHASLKDAAVFLGCPVIRFRHRDVERAARMAQRLGAAAKPILLTDGMFSYNGGTAPLRAYRTALPKNVWMLVDDSHAAGVVGSSGRGTIEQEEIARSRVIQTITLSKAFGVAGGAILGTNRLRDRLLTQSRMLIGSTPMPFPLAAAALAALKLVKTDAAMRHRLRDNVGRVRSRLRDAGIDVEDQPGPIVSVTVESKAARELLTKELLSRKIYPSLIQYPGGPAPAYFRFVISSEHTASQLDALARALISYRRKGAASGRRRSGGLVGNRD
ncbi:MAG TPA: pyridoxal phosphate-dependent aminotransferase family protein [Candidatus Nitrosotalea sp.]|nr:pyridoxal phosphate-dependent aminotransferase family protein [Candidatus Nitrosotalea sp.]